MVTSDGSAPMDKNKSTLMDENLDKNLDANLELCRSSREQKVSTKLKDYICNTVWQSPIKSHSSALPFHQTLKVSLCILLQNI